jgi:hypothetical protein
VTERTQGPVSVLTVSPDAGPPPDAPISEDPTAGAGPRGRFDVRASYHRHFTNPRRERAFLHAAGFTTAFATCRIVTHSIRAGIGPFQNMSVGGRHLHHSTFGILGQIGLGYLTAYQLALGVNPHRRAASRASAAASGVFTALTLDEFALWFDLHDDYWDAAGRKSIDAVALFGGLSVMGLAGRGVVKDCAKAARDAAREARKV